MASTILKTRMRQKIDTSENWAKATNFVPLKGEICIYSDLQGQVKIGDGTSKIGDLRFSGETFIYTLTVNEAGIPTFSSDYATVLNVINKGFYDVRLSYTPTSSNDFIYIPFTNKGTCWLDFSCIVDGILYEARLSAANSSFKTQKLEPLVGSTEDTTPTQVKEAILAGRPVLITYTDTTYGNLTFTSFGYSLENNVVVANLVAISYSKYILVDLTGNSNNNNWTLQTTELGTSTDIANNYVKYSESQTLTDKQKATARTNIGAISSSELVQSDWNQNDETAKDYIKNRICYTKDATETIVLNSTLPFTDISNSGLTVFRYRDTSSNIKFNEGTTYTVNFDTTSYTCIAFTDDSLSNMVILGNLGIIGLSSVTNEPFAIITDNEGDYGLQIVTNLTGTSHNVKIVENHTEIVKLDKKYIPDDIFINIENIDNKVEDFINNAQFLAKTDSVGTGSFSFNRETGSTVGENSATFGLNNIASGKYAFAEGAINKATNFASHAEGNGTTASGLVSHAEGSNTKATGARSHSEGLDTVASGDYSHAEGEGTTAEGMWSHTEGKSTNTKGWASHAEGSEAVAQGNCSHAEGRFTVALGENQHVEGILNIEDTTSLHIVGNGTYTESSGQKTKSNAHTLDKLGNAWFAGNVYVGSTSGTNKDDGSKKLATEEYVNNKTTTITVDDTLSDTSTNPAQNKVIKTELDNLFNTLQQRIESLNDYVKEISNRIPEATTANNGQFLRVVNGVPTWVALTNVAEEGA